MGNTQMMPWTMRELEEYAAKHVASHPQSANEEQALYGAAMWAVTRWPAGKVMRDEDSSLGELLALVAIACGEILDYKGWYSQWVWRVAQRITQLQGSTDTVTSQEATSLRNGLEQRMYAVQAWRSSGKARPAQNAGNGNTARSPLDAARREMNTAQAVKNVQEWMTTPRPATPTPMGTFTYKPPPVKMGKLVLVRNHGSLAIQMDIREDGFINSFLLSEVQMHSTVNGQSQYNAATGEQLIFIPTDQHMQDSGQGVEMALKCRMEGNYAHSFLRSFVGESLEFDYEVPTSNPGAKLIYRFRAILTNVEVQLGHGQEVTADWRILLMQPPPPRPKPVPVNAGFKKQFEAEKDKPEEPTKVEELTKPKTGPKAQQSRKGKR